MENEIKATSDYQQFNLFKGNRQIKEHHVRNLIQSIKENNLLSLRPIIVDTEWNVIDGQHRLEAAKHLETPIYYIQVRNENVMDIISLNQYQKNWKLEDYIQFHAERLQNENYIKIQETLSKYNIPLNVLFIYINLPIKKRKVRKDFESGHFIWTTPDETIANNYSYWKALHDFMESIDHPYKKHIDTTVFFSAFYYFCNSKLINVDNFINKFKSSPSLFYHGYNKDEYLDILLKIYNNGCVHKILKSSL